MLCDWKVFLVLTFAAVDILGIRLFYRGRSFGGNYGIPPVTVDADNLPPEQWFKQKLDHFNPSDERTWLQRYFKNDSFFDRKLSRNVFLMIGGEGNASPEWMVAGQWIEYAKKFNALCFQLEHRYYGSSHPTFDLSTKNLMYLNSEQALADLANFINSINSEYKLKNKAYWVVFGGSYPGSLAAWMRLKYPHLVHAAVSSSGPLLAKVDFMEYFSVVVDALNTAGSGCVMAIKEGTQQLNILNAHPLGQKSLDDKFRLCDPLENASNLDKANFFENLASNFAGVVQYNKDNRIGESKKLSNITIDLLCQLMTDKTVEREVDRLANVNSLLLNISNQTCLDYNYKKMIKELSDVSWNSSSAEGGRQWTYQTCTEFGFYQTSSAQWEIFSSNFPVDFFVKQCEDIFGSKFNQDYLEKAAIHTNMIYGGLDIAVTRVVYVHGSIDPWHALGITETKDSDAPAIYIKGTAHCANMYPPKDDDLPDLKAARESVEELLTIWLEK